MTTLTDIQKFKILQLACGDFLTEYFPDGWESMNSDDQDQFMADHAWEPLENSSTEVVYGMIETSARRTIEYAETLKK